jgi:hypothetical protein
LGCLLLAAPLAHGQTASLEPGDRIRITHRLEDEERSEEKLTGIYQGVTPNGLEIRSPLGSEAYSREIPLHAVVRVERSAGESRSRGARRGAWIGAIAGVTFTLVNVAAGQVEGEGWGGVVGLTAAVAAVSAGAGALIGAVIGRESWDEGTLPPAERGS